jgi:hypothetical protein
MGFVEYKAALDTFIFERIVLWRDFTTLPVIGLYSKEVPTSTVVMSRATCVPFVLLFLISGPRLISVATDWSRSLTVQRCVFALQPRELWSLAVG